MTPANLKAAKAWLATWAQPSEKSLELITHHPDLTGRLRLLHHCSYWDGPITGRVMLDGEDGFWVEMREEHFQPRLDLTEECETCDCGPHDACFTWSRLYAVYRLTDEQNRIETANHDLFRRFVGGHTDYDEEGQRLGAVHQPREQWDGFYKADRERMSDFDDSQIVGWSISLWPDRRRR